MRKYKGKIEMKQNDYSEFSSQNFNDESKTDAEYNRSIEEYKGEIQSLNNNLDLVGIPHEDIERELRLRLQIVMQISKSSVGLLFGSVKIFNDWDKLSEFGLHPGDWFMHLSRLIQNLKQDGDFETDRLQAKTIKNPVLKLLFVRGPMRNKAKLS